MSARPKTSYLQALQRDGLVEEGQDYAYDSETNGSPTPSEQGSDVGSADGAWYIMRFSLIPIRAISLTCAYMH